MAGHAHSPMLPDAAAALPAKPGPLEGQITGLRNSVREEPRVTLREISALLLLIVLCDVTIYRGAGFAGIALLLLLAPGLLLLGNPRPWLKASFWTVGGMLLILSARMVWLGSGWTMGIGIVLLVAFSLALHGLSPCVLDIPIHAAQTVLAGCQGLAHYGGSLARRSPRFPRLRWLNLALPVAALGLFGTLFVLANPDVSSWITQTADRYFRWQWEWLEGLEENWLEACFWVAVAWVCVGLLRPIVKSSVLAPFTYPSQSHAGATSAAEESPLYGALRNTLVAVSVLFAVYLVFEFQTLWFRQFPTGFYYAGYAHEGAGWLTAALALATLVLSLIFQGKVLRDPRLARLRGLAWIWSAENLVLALTVYHRMYIYIDFNGMTRMRSVGLFGISAVVVGFCLVLWKIVYDRDFAWLIRRQLWTLAIAVYLFALTPVDALVHSYNVRQILAGDLAPSVQISVHPINSEGLLVLHPLADCEDPIIREGILALLAQRAVEAELVAQERAESGWTTYQIADDLLLDRLRARRQDWEEYLDDSKRAAALARFHEYAYQWY